MSRCIICDYSSELSTGPKRDVKWDDKEKGFVCSECQKEHFELLYANKNRYEYSPTDGEVPFLEDEYEDVSVEGLDVLAEQGLAED